MTTVPEANSGLDLRGVTVRYGGNTAVSDVSLSAPRGRLTGLIGPNGAGKTTIFNACSGLQRPSAGTIRLFDHDVTRLRPAARARRGMGRTFQRLELCDGMTVRENLVLGVEAAMAGDNPVRHLIGTRRQRERVSEAVDDAVEICGLGGLVEVEAGHLSTGQRRLVELARVRAGGYRMLLLDEPSSGLDHGETENFSRILRSLVAQGIGILLVEHDMGLVMSVCEYLFVLDFGTLIFEGTPAEVRTSELVRSAYLGSEVGLEAAQARRSELEVTQAVER